MEDYIVTIAVKGYVRVPVKSNQIKNVEEKATDCVYDMDFGELQDIEWDALRIKTPSGEYIELK